MVRFSDLLGRDGGDDDDKGNEVPRDATPTEPVPPPPTEPPPPPPPGSSPSNELLDRLTTFSSTRAAAPEPEPRQEPYGTRFGLPPELFEAPGDEPVTAAMVSEAPASAKPSEAPYVDTLAPVDDDLLPRRRSK
jgi:hypothetical protein